MNSYSQQMKKMGSIVLLGALMAACGGASEETNEELDELMAKRDSLKAELTIINTKITELDTSKEVLIPLVSASDVVERRFVHKVEVQGGVESDKNALVNAEASGMIDRIHVKEGQKVSAGSPLITIDAEILASNIEEVKTSLEMAEYMLEKQEKLMDSGLGVEMEYTQAKNQVESLKKRLKTMQTQKGKTTVRAPFTGIVEDVMVSMGEMAAPGVPLLRIVNNDEVTVSASLSENLLSKISEGSEVELRIPSLGDTVIQSSVKSRGNYIDPVNRTFRIIVEVKDNELLLPNQLAKVNVVDFVRDSALVVNAESILQDTQNRNYVYKLIDFKDGDYAVEKVFVKVHKRYQGDACVSPMGKSSLSGGDRIVLEGAKGITVTDRVQVQK